MRLEGPHRACCVSQGEKLPAGPEAAPCVCVRGTINNTQQPLLRLYMEESEAGRDVATGMTLWC